MTTAPTTPNGDATLGAIRRFLLLALAFSLVGTEVELLLLDHTADAWQLVPVALLGLGIGVIAWHALSPSHLNVRVIQALMFLLIASGGLGVFFHYRGNVEWELESDAGMRGFTLFREAITGATPSLAPGTMVLIGMVGLAYAFRHPALRGTERHPPSGPGT